MNEAMDVRSLLLAAAKLVERATLQLDVAESTCGECGGRHFHNRVHAKAYERITNVPTKLRSVVVLLDTGQEPTADQIVDTTAEALGIRRQTRP